MAWRLVKQGVEEILITEQAPAEAAPNHCPGSALKKLTREMAEGCAGCSTCREGCAFLIKYGTPGELAAAYDPSLPAFQVLPYECSLCRLCSAVCPRQLNPADMFLEMRRAKPDHSPAAHAAHGPVLAYEKRGVSRFFTWYSLPAGCDAVFFPGCALAGMNVDRTVSIYEHLKKGLPDLGIVLDCCLKISHDLGREDYFQPLFQEMVDFLRQKGVKNIIVACPNCYRIFKTYGGQLPVRTVYEVLAEGPLPVPERLEGTVTIHDPCPLRFAPLVQAAVRDLLARLGLTIREMPHRGEKTLCCGEGGFVSALSPELAGKWVALRKAEAAGDRIITYCAGCTNHLDKVTPASHIVDLLFAPAAVMAGRVNVTRAPFTYLNRWRLKRRIQRDFPAPVTRERTFSLESEQPKGRVMKVMLFLLLIVLILAVQFTGAARHLDQESLRQWIQGYGALAPLVYMLIYTLAPSLLLPGLPLTIAGGVLFGPFWGVVYTIIGATLGACLAFIVARHLARGWVEGKLKGSQWQRLDQEVEKHGWKVVAFTRLIPVFPFNLLNYAFGLTKIGFLTYALSSLIFMLPATVAYIVFSSSLLDLFKGEISLTFIAGLALVVMVSLLPVLYRRYKNKKGIRDPF